MRYCIISPFLQINNFSLQLDNLRFFLLVLTTILIAAAGYVINDYFDVRTDRINKPDKVIIDSGIHRRSAIFLHSIFTPRRNRDFVYFGLQRPLMYSIIEYLIQRGFGILRDIDIYGWPNILKHPDIFGQFFRGLFPVRQFI